MVARGVRLLLVALVPLIALAQTYPYFPPPGLTYNSSTHQISSAGLQPAGSSTQVQYNQAGVLTGNSLFTFNQGSDVLNVGASNTPGTYSVGQLDSMTVNGVSIPVPGFALNSNIQGVLEVHSYVNGAGAGAARLYGARSEGTISSPTIVQNTDSLLSLYAIGFNGVANSYLTGGRIQFLVNGTPSATAMPTDFDLSLAPAGSSTLTSRLHVYQDGGAVLSAPAGGDEGAGTMNAAGYFINGVAVSAPQQPTNVPSYRVQATDATNSTGSGTPNNSNSLAFGSMVLNAAGFFRVHCWILYTTAGGATFLFTPFTSGTTTGIGHVMDGINIVGGAVSNSFQAATTNTFQTATANSTAGTVWLDETIDYTTGSGNSIQFNFATGTAPNVATLKAGSWCKLEKMG